MSANKQRNKPKRIQKAIITPFCLSAFSNSNRSGRGSRQDAQTSIPNTSSQPYLEKSRPIMRVIRHGKSMAVNRISANVVQHAEKNTSYVPSKFQKKKSFDDYA